MSLRDRFDAVNEWLANWLHGPYIRELDYMRELLNRDESDYAGACDIEGCHRVALSRYETEKQYLRLCSPCGQAFQRGLFDRDVAVSIGPIEREARDDERVADAPNL